jgi:putative NIF3 family GTP cyclohydrolase 1 type 2
MTTLRDLEVFLTETLLADQFSDDQNGLYRASERPIKRLGLALEPSPDTADWVRREGLDALFLHRPWKLGALPEGIGVLAYHYAFDERLTTGYNPYLAETLGMAGLEVLGEKEGRSLGMIGEVAPVSFNHFQAHVVRAFAGLEATYNERVREVTRICVVGAMRPELVQEAAARGAQVYLTGEYRKRVAQAVTETGLTVLEIGHERSERWGLGALADILEGAFPGLEPVIFTS